MENPELIKGTDCNVKTMYQAVINKLYLVEVTGLFWKPHLMFLLSLYFGNDCILGMFLFDVNVYIYIYIYLSEYVYQ